MSNQKVLMECKGNNSNLILTIKGIIIERRGGFFSTYKKEKKTILYTDIRDFQYHKSGIFSYGFIYFKVEGQEESIGYFDAASHEYAITFLDDKRKRFDKAKKIITEKVNLRKYDNFIEGKNGSLELTETGVCIRRTGVLLSGFPSGEKNIPYRNITAVQFKKVDLTVGFIQLSILGGVEAQGGAFNAVTDENTVTYDDLEKTVQFEKIKKIIERKILEPNFLIQNSSQKINDEFEQLEKLAALKDRGIVTEEEFQFKKKQILGL